MTKRRKSRIGRNPNQPEDVVEIPAKNIPCFKPGKEMKTAAE
jgi:nucleoid DNA-binding protein